MCIVVLNHNEQICILLQIKALCIRVERDTHCKRLRAGLENPHNACRVRFATAAMHTYQLPVVTKEDMKRRFEEKQTPVNLAFVSEYRRFQNFETFFE